METKQSLFLVNASGDLVRLQPSAPADEDSLQGLIAKHPDIIGDSDGSLLLVRREQSIGDSENGSGRWSLDHLFVTRSAVPVLVEVKRAVDTRLRREVVGQMLDYAANGVAYWPSGQVADAFARTAELAGQDADSMLSAFLGDDVDIDEFWSQVDANFRAGRIKLVFVADRIPRELARIVEFLNEQMTADVRAVELQYFEGDGGLRTLAPRIIGETERAQAQKSSAHPQPVPLTADEWIETYIAPRGAEILSGFKQALSLIEGLGGEYSVTSSQGSIITYLSLGRGTKTYPLSLLKNGTASINFGYLESRLSEETRREFFDRFNEAVGPLSTNNYRSGFPAFPLELLTDPRKVEAFGKVARDWFDAARSAGT